MSSIECRVRTLDPRPSTLVFAFRLPAGRLVQRVLEIETYRMMALLGLPHAQHATPVLSAIEGELATLTAAMTDTDESKADALSRAVGDEKELLRSITGLAARLEKLSLDNSYRFSASKAYFRLVRARGIGLFVPPSGAEPVISRFPRLLALLEWADRLFAGPLARFSDHMLLDFERVDTARPKEPAA